MKPFFRRNRFIFHIQNQTTQQAYFLERVSDGLESVHNPSARKILSTKACLPGKKRSKVEHLARIFNAAGAFLSHNIAAR